MQRLMHRHTKYNQHIKMRKLSLVAAIAFGGLVACLSTAYAQPGGGGGGGGARGARGAGAAFNATNRLAQIDTAVTLTAEQKPKVKAILEDEAKKLTDLQNDTTVAAADRRTKRTEIQTKADDDIKKLLTADQVTKYPPVAPARGTRGGGARGGGAAPGA